ncbi:MAG: polysaccharide pyruvyl transferase family protein [Pseudomonadota bacterium]
MKRILLFGHGGFYNRGCEAIVRGTVSLLQHRFREVYIKLASYDHIRDSTRKFGLVDEIIPHVSPRWSFPWAMARVADRIRPNGGMAWWTVPLKNALRDVDAVLSIGGDNYCYSATSPYGYIDNLVRDMQLPLVLWGASVDTNGATPDKIENLKAFDLITARESMTFNNLVKSGISSNVKIVADPAFLMSADPVDTISFWPEGDGVFGLNISPLLNRYRLNKETSDLLNATQETVRYIIDQLGFGVLLIPHVTRPMGKGDKWNDDYDAMYPLIDRVKRPGRLKIVPGEYNAMQIKHIISKCRFFVGGRTHSTIAALSSGIPTLSIGYSIKAWGINVDIFRHSHYVCDIGSLNAQSFIDSVNKLVQDEHKVRSLLEATIPRIKDLAFSGVNYLAELLGGE